MPRQIGALALRVINAIHRLERELSALEVGARFGKGNGLNHFL
jgi:hypothetical protein